MTGTLGANLREIAKRASVSLSTVSRALSGHPHVRPETRRRVLEAARELNYDVGRLRKDRVSLSHPLLALLLPDVTTPFYSQMLHSVHQAVFARGADLVLYVGTGYSPSQVIERVAQARHLSGIIVVTPRHAEDENLKKLGAELSVVVLDHRAEGSGFPHVTVDNLRAAHRAVTHLVERGRRRIGMITGPLHIQSAMDRLRGYRLALEEAGTPFDPDLVKEGNFHQHTGYEITRAWIDSGKPLPDALFCANDLMAIGALQALRERGLCVPDDIALVGFDDLPLAEAVDPPLTTVAQPIQEMAETAVRLVMRLIQGEELDVHRVVLEAHLVVRAST